MKSFVCIACTGERAAGCTLISESDGRLPRVCQERGTRAIIFCDWLEIPDDTRDEIFEISKTVGGRSARPIIDLNI